MAIPSGSVVSKKKILRSSGLRIFENVPFMDKKGHGSGAGTGGTEISALSYEREREEAYRKLHDNGVSQSPLVLMLLAARCRV